MCRERLTEALLKSRNLGVPLSDVWDNRNFYFGKKTATDTIRRHLDRFHKDEYLSLVKEKGWVNKLPSHKKELKQQGKAVDLEPKVKYSVEELHRHLVNWIVADDQVILSRLVTYMS